MEIDINNKLYCFTHKMQGWNLPFGKKKQPELFFFTMTTVNAELVFNILIEKLRNVRAA